MSSETEKLGRFSQAVYGVAEKQVDEIILEARSERDKEIEKENDASLNRSYENIKENVRLIRNKYVKLVASEELLAKREVLEHREKLSQTVFENAAEKLKAFRESDGYCGYLVKLAKKLCRAENGKNGVIKIAPADEKYSGKILEAAGNGFEIIADKDIKMGGLAVFYPDKNLLFDNTVDCAFDEQKELFHKTAQLKIH